MSAPVLQERPLEITSASYSGGRWLAEFNSPIGFSLLIEESGDDSPLVEVKVNWGDGEIESQTGIVVGYNHQFSHLYANRGDYVISVTAKNRSGSTSTLTSSNTASVYILGESERQKALYRWIGPILKQEEIGYAFNTAQDEPARSFLLAGQHKSGDSAIQLRTNESINVGSEFLITQQGKLLTAGRIIAANLNSLQIDTTLNADYGPTATVEITQPASVKQYERSLSPRSGGFLLATDEELVRHSLLIAMGTRVGERLFNPRKGSRLHELVFEPNDVVTAQKAYKYTVESTRDEPRVLIHSVTHDVKGHGVTVRAVYSLRGAAEDTFEVIIPLGNRDI